MQVSWGSWRRRRGRGGRRIRRLWRRARRVWSGSTCCCSSKCLKNLQSDLLKRLTKSWYDWPLSHSTYFICDVPDFRKTHWRTHATYPSTRIEIAVKHSRIKLWQKSDKQMSYKFTRVSKLAYNIFRLINFNKYLMNERNTLCSAKVIDKLEWKIFQDKIFLMQQNRLGWYENFTLIFLFA